MLHVQKLNKTYNGAGKTVHALLDVSLEIATGELAIVRGPSGSGKSTLLLCCGALLRPTSGIVKIDGENPYSMSPSERAHFRASLLGFVFQQFHLVPYLNVLENVLVPSLANPNRSSLARDRARDLLDQFGLTPRMRHLPQELSVGERQRVALARALLNDPKLILADEPTGNLDEDNADAVLKALQAFTANGGSALLVTHDRGILAYGHRVVQLVAGRIEHEDSGVVA
jgi:ABC-type lipoprotein export system ATPase subunit